MWETNSSDAFVCYDYDMKSKYKKPAVIIGVVIAVLVAAVYVLYFIDWDAPDGMRMVKSYRDTSNDEVVCLALSPGCGICPGEVINKKCYVKKGSYEQYE